jgi:anti-repressor protein
MNITTIETALAPTAHEGQPMIDARGLHGWLGIPTRFHVWVARRIEEYGFIEGLDFRTILVKTGGRPKSEYLLTLDMAKELAMVERSEIGRETRRYFRIRIRRRFRLCVNFDKN